jgi:hypothetical protein
MFGGLTLGLLAFVCLSSQMGMGSERKSKIQAECDFPPPDYGPACTVRCVESTWEKVCKGILIGRYSKPRIGLIKGRDVRCGDKPTPEIGCKIDKCNNGKWEQVCNQEKIPVPKKKLNH